MLGLLSVPGQTTPAEDDSCNLLNPFCALSDKVSEFANDTLADLGNSVLESVGSTAAAVGTAWVGIPTPNLTGGGGGSQSAGWDTPPGVDGTVETPGNSGSWTTTPALNDILGWATWLAFGVAVLSLIAWGARFAWSRSGDMDREMGRLGTILGATVIVSAASGIVAALLPSARNASNTSDSVAFLQDSLWYYVAALAVFSVIIGGIKMAWQQRAQPGIDIVRSIITLVLVSAVGVSVAGILVVASDGFANWILDRSLECNGENTQACFGQNVVNLFAPLMASGIGIFLVIIAGVIGILLTLLQVILMLARSAMLVILTGILPLSASATNTEMGQGWFRKNVAWLIAFALYKPAVAIVFAVGFQLMGSNYLTGDNPIVSMAAGFMLLLLSIVALPALMRFVTPMVGAVGAGGGAAGVGAAAAMAMPTGAMALGRGGGGSGGGDESSSSGPSGSSSAPSGSGGDEGGSGPGGGSGSGSGGGSGPSKGGASNGSSGADVDLTDSPSPTGGPGSGGGSPVPAGVGASGGAGSGASGAAAAGASNGAGAGAAGGASGAGAGAGAAGGPPGMAAEAVAEGARQGIRKAQEVADDSTGDQGGPNGSK